MFKIILLFVFLIGLFFLFVSIGGSILGHDYDKQTQKWFDNKERN